MDSDALLALIGRMYDAAVDPTLWPRVLNEIADAVGAQSSHFVVQDLQRNEIPVFHGPRTDPQRIEDYARYHITRNPWLPSLARLPAGTVVPDHRLAPREELVRTEFYHDYLCKRGVAYGLGVVAMKDDVLQSYLSLYRTPAQGGFDDAAMQLGYLLLPHLRRAVQISQNLAVAQAREASALAMLERMPCGVVLLDGRERVVHCNATAERIIVRNDGLSIRRGNLCAAMARDTAALRRLLATAADTRLLGTRGGALALARPSQKRPLGLLVLPVPSRTSDQFAGLAPRVAVLITDPEERAAEPRDIWRLLYGLTPVENTVAYRLINGESPREIGEALGIAFETARRHLKNIMAKTDTHRQAELVRLLLHGQQTAMPGG